MKVALLSLVVIVGFVFYIALINGVFKRCPYCGKIGSWRYDKVAPPVEDKDKDGYIVKSIQTLRRRSCKKEVTEVWSDFEGRSFRKKGENN